MWRFEISYAHNLFDETIPLPLKQKLSDFWFWLCCFQLYRSMVGPDGWCIHFEKSTRKCSIYEGKAIQSLFDPEEFVLL